MTIIFRYRLVRYVSVGVVGAVIHYACYLILINIGFAGPILASAIASLLGGVCNYLANYHFTFSSQQRHHEAASRFIAVAALGWLVNLGSMIVFYTWLGIHYLVAQVISTVVSFLFNYLGCSKWVFQTSHKKPTSQ